MLAALTFTALRDGRGLTASTAMRVPAFNRATRLITGTVASFPLVQWRDGVMVPGTGLLEQPEPDRTSWTTLQRTTEDLCHYGVAYWEVRDVDANGYPVKVRVLPAHEVHADPARPETHLIYNANTYPVSHPAGPGTNVGSVIVFTGYRRGVLQDGYDTILLAAALEDAAKRYASSPLPQVALKNSGADLTPDEVQALLTQWETARNERSTAYLSSVMEAQSFGWSAAELQLADARNHSAVQISRLFNLDPMWVGASLPGTSMTYANRVDLRKDLVDLTLMDYLCPIEQRLSMRDVTPTIHNNVVRFNTSAFLRSNLAERASMVATLMPLNVLTTDEAREFLQDSPTTKAYPS